GVQLPRRRRAPQPLAASALALSTSGGEHFRLRVGRRPWRRRRSGVELQQQSPAAPPLAADSADELRRRAEKAKIRERILREEAEHL
ncbi:unnamed protein product, partial [Urochloa humidicola]